MPPPKHSPEHSSGPATSTALDEIMERKRRSVARQRARTPIGRLREAAREQPPAKDFAAALARPGLQLIAEVKKASPSKGLIRANFEPAAHARDYESGGAACVSVLTDEEGFQGDDRYLQMAREACALPILRKDFFWDPYQVVEARALGADAVLVILAAVEDGRARDLMEAADEWGMAALVEVHDDHELDRAAALGARLIGVNNRDLKTFTTRLDTFERLAPRAPEGCILVAESGIASAADAQRMAAAGAGAILVGETLMRQDDVETATRALMAPWAAPA